MQHWGANFSIHFVFIVNTVNARISSRDAYLIFWVERGANSKGALILKGRGDANSSIYGM